MYNQRSAYLKHYGILGMRWGRRKGEASNSSKKNKVSPDYKEAVVIKKKKLSQMSNAELKTLNNRLQLERQYRDLTKKDLSGGKKLIKTALDEVAKETVKTLIKSVVTGAGEIIVEGNKKSAAISAAKKSG